MFLLSDNYTEHNIMAWMDRIRVEFCFRKTAHPFYSF